MTSGTITPRDLRFSLETPAQRYWCNGDPGRTAIFDALSILFPEGEAFFIASVRHFGAGVSDPVLKNQIAAFTRQEAFHSREHNRYNQAIRDRVGGVATRLEDAVRARLQRISQRGGPYRALATTCALEHFTAIMSDVLLRDPRFLDGADPDYARLWLWHAIEETEHKAVAYDVMLTAVPGWRRYLLRVSGMATTTLLFNYYITKHIYRLLKVDGLHLSARVWLTVVNQLLGRPGILRRIFWAWAAYFRPGFHPWQHDNRAMLEQKKSILSKC